MRILDSQNFWYFVFSVLFIFVLAGMLWFLGEGGRSVPRGIAIFDFILIILATFRLIRLFVYDKITQFIRDWFIPISHGPRRTIGALLSCPWCTGVWIAPFVIFFYYSTPLAWFVILVLAIAGVASFIQVLANMIGWRAEYLKHGTHTEKE